MKNFLFTILGGFLALIVFVLGSLFGEFVNVLKGSQSSQSSSSELVINEQISASIEATPDIYISYPSFYAKNISDDDKSMINAHFSGILTLVKENGLCTGGAYQTYNEMNKDGLNSLSLSSELACKFSANKLEQYNKLIADIENLIKSSVVKLHLTAINPAFSPEAEAKNQSELKSALSAAATNAAQNLSSDFNKTCVLNELNFNGASYYRASLAEGGAAAKISAPELKSKSLKANADAKYICK